MERVDAMQVLPRVRRRRRTHQLLQQRAVGRLLDRLCMETIHQRIGEDGQEGGVVLARVVNDGRRNGEIGVVAALVGFEHDMSGFASKHLQTAAEVALVRESAVHKQRIVVADEGKRGTVDGENVEVLAVLK